MKLKGSRVFLVRVGEEVTENIWPKMCSIFHCKEMSEFDSENLQKYSATKCNEKAGKTLTLRTGN